MTTAKGVITPYHRSEVATEYHGYSKPYYLQMEEKGKFVPDLAKPEGLAKVWPVVTSYTIIGVKNENH